MRYKLVSQGSSGRFTWTRHFLGAAMADVFFQEVSTAMVAIRISPEVQQKRDRKVDAGLCLMCEKPLSEIPGAPKRGCCARCYQAFLRAKQRKTTDEKRLIKDGRLLSVGKRGRRAISPEVREIIEGY